MRIISQLSGHKILMALADPPSDREIEVSIFGPGYGECIVVHAGGNEWAIIDACLDKAGHPAALAYLRQIGVDPAVSVRAVIANDWQAIM